MRRAARASGTVRVLRRLPARWIGECRRRRPPGARPAPPGAGEAAGGSAPGSPPPRRLRASHNVLRIASACACARAAAAVFGFGCAAQRSVTRRWSGRPRRRRAAAAPRPMRNGHCSRPSAAAWTCTADGGGDSASALNGRFAASANGAPAAVLGVHVGVGFDERSDHSAIAVHRRPVQRGVAIAVHGGAGVRGWAPRGYPSTQPVSEKQNSTLAPRVDYGVVLGNR